MKPNSLLLTLLALLTLTAFTPIQAQVVAAPAKMTFQGRLTKPDGTPVADGTYSVRFSLHDALAGGTEKWSQTLANVSVRNGTFAALLDVNTANLFAGDLYLEIKIGSDAPLTPRQPLVSVPYALKANTVPDGSIAADKLAGDALNNLSWLLGGNAAGASHFLGTTNNQPLVFKTNNAERLRLDSNGNLGIGNNAPAFPLSFSGALGDKISLWGGPGDNYGFGIQHSLLQIHTPGSSSDIAFGYGQSATMTEVMRIKGSGNVGIGTNDPQAKLHINGTAGITGNFMLKFGAGVTGKQIDAGKIGYQAYSDALDIIGAGTEGGNRKIKFWNEGGAVFTGGASINGTVQMTGFQMPTGAGAGRVLTSDASGNGVWGNVSVAWSNIAGIPGGLGGIGNTASGLYATVAGGDNNNAFGQRATIAGGSNIQTSGDYTTIAGGSANTANGNYSTVGGGSRNQTFGTYAFVGGGSGNITNNRESTVSGGGMNTAHGNFAIVGGGYGNTASGHYAIVGGGYGNTASGEHATLAGGNTNNAGGQYATVSGGNENTATGDYSFVAGRNALATHRGSFVWSDSINVGFSSSIENQFNIRASGGTRIFSNADATTGVLLAAGAGSWSSASDRNLKTNFQNVDTLDVLEKLVAIPLTTWHYKANQDIRHIGPMAQDFYKAFGGLGMDDKHIDTVDADGVAFAAIQGLNKKLEAQNAELKARVERLEAMLQQMLKK